MGLRDYRFSFPPYPIGWFQVAYTDELEVGEVKPLEYFGQHLVIFRTEDGAAHVLDAHCPHLGAHLGYGGTIEGQSIRCPFHAWRFDCSGTCDEVPYGNKIPAKAVIKKWPVHEANGMILVWHHPDGDVEPTFTLPHVPEYGDEGWTSLEKRQWKIRSRNQEMAENAVDQAHFHYLHGTQNIPQSELTADGPIMTVRSTTVMTTPGGEVTGKITSINHGFGFAMVRFEGIVETLLLSSTTAIDDEYVDVRFSFLIKKMGGRSTTAGIGAAFVKEIARQLEQDIPIWENKKHIKPPILCDGDGPIGKFRKWCKQFYADPNAIP